MRLNFLREVLRRASLLGLLVCLLRAEKSVAAQTAEARVHEWGKASYVSLTVGESHRFLNRVITLHAVDGPTAVIDVNGTRETLIVARRSLPKAIAGVRVFLADNRAVATLTKNEQHAGVHDALRGDALLCLSDATKPLLDPERFTFPISRADGYEWSMEEDSHMFAYLGPTRQHEGMDLNIHDARGIEKHPLIAIEAGIVRWIETAQAGAHEACLLLESTAEPGLFYVYQHLNREKVFVRPGQKVERGQKLAYIWGDWRWGHLHFAVSRPGQAPDYVTRYKNVLNAFPQLLELWHGTLAVKPRKWTSGDFEFAKEYWSNGNRQRLSVYDDIVGYGWLLGSWCVEGKVEKSVNRGNQPGQSALLRKKLHRNTSFPVETPDNHFDFEIAVERGRFAVKAEVGDRFRPTWQKISFEGNHAGTYSFASKGVEWTPEQQVDVTDGKLTVRIVLKDSDTEAGLSALSFRRLE